jgi:hypothetical protein
MSNGMVLCHEVPHSCGSFQWQVSSYSSHNLNFQQPMVATHALHTGICVNSGMLKSQK